MDFNEEFSIFTRAPFIVKLIRRGNYEVFFSDWGKLYE